MNRLNERSKVLSYIFVLGGIVLAMQLFYIQILDNGYQQLANDTTVSKKKVFPSRGLIFDKNQILLVENEASYNLIVNYSLVDKNVEIISLCKILEITQEEYKKRLEQDWKSIHYSKKTPFIFYGNISVQQYNQLQEHMYKYRGFSFQSKSRRTYPIAAGANFLGYMNETNLRQINEDHFYSPGDYIGSAGLESFYEEILRGEKGIKYTLRNKFGKEIKPFQRGELDKKAQRGSNLTLGIDIELQKFAEELLRDKRGSIVAIEPQTGKILCLATGPNFDPNLLTINKNRAKTYNELLKNPNKPLFDRSTMAKYPPGSIFKTFVALVALELGVTQAKRYIPCNGMYYYNGIPFKCHLHPRTYDVQTALEFSCNTYFRLLLRNIVDFRDFYNPQIGLDTFNYYSSQFGLGARLGIDLRSESTGNIPTKEYYDKLYPRDQGRWKSPTIMSIGIGQGEIEMSNLQMANLAAAIANRGYFITPHLVDYSSNSKEGKTSYNYSKNSINIRQEHFTPIIEGMKKVIHTGTGQSAAVPDIEFCGKTGTSQNPHGDDHSIFFGFAPLNNPEIAVSVIVENSGAGSTIAAPISGLIVEYYLKDSIADNRKYLINYIRSIKNNAL